MVFVRIFLFCLQMAVAFGLTINLSKQRMMDYFQYANVTEADIDDLVSNVNGYHFISNRIMAAERWVENHIDEGAKGYAKNLTNFVQNLVNADRFTRVILRGLKRTKIVPVEDLEQVRDQYYHDQEHVYGNDLMYSFCSMYVNYMETFNFTQSTMDELKTAQEKNYLLPEHYSTNYWLWTAYRGLKWKPLYADNRSLEEVILTYNSTDTFGGDSIKDRLFKKMLDKMISLL